MDDDRAAEDSRTQRIASHRLHKLKVVTSDVFRAKEKVYVYISFHLSQI